MASESGESAPRADSAKRENAQEAVNHFSRLPEEMIDQIARDLTGKDLFAFGNSSSDLRNVVSSKYTTKLFSEVLPVLLPYLDKSSVLGCAGACHDWNLTVRQTMSKVLRNESYKPKVVPHTVPLDKRVLREDSYVTDLSEGPTRAQFQHHFGVHYEFDVQIKQLRLVPARIDAAWCRQVLTFLFFYGEHVWELVIGGDQIEMDALTYNNLIVMCLGKTRNLRILRLTGSAIVHLLNREAGIQWRGRDMPVLPDLTSILLNTDDVYHNNLAIRIMPHYRFTLTQLCLAVNTNALVRIVQVCPQLNNVTLSRNESNQTLTIPNHRDRIPGPKRHLKILFDVRLGMVNAERPEQEERNTVRRLPGDVALHLAHVLNLQSLELCCKGFVHVHYNGGFQPSKPLETESLMFSFHRIRFNATFLQVFQNVFRLHLTKIDCKMTVTFQPERTFLITRDSTEKVTTENDRTTVTRLFKELMNLRVIEVDKNLNIFK